VVRPRGLASLLFALLSLEELREGADRAVTVIGLTVLISVLVHGLSANPPATGMGRLP
jgi:NhaP-type Na+/H+ or K+/H+ antiporter